MVLIRIIYLFTYLFNYFFFISNMSLPYCKNTSFCCNEICGKRKANWIGHILRRNCLLKQVIEGKIKGEMEVARRRGRRRKKLLDNLKDRSVAVLVLMYRGADKSLARPGRKQTTATEDFHVHISYL